LNEISGGAIAGIIVGSIVFVVLVSTVVVLRSKITPFFQRGKEKGDSLKPLAPAPQSDSDSKTNGWVGGNTTRELKNV